MELKTKTIIIENKRCAWGKCIFCSFSKKKDMPFLSEKKQKQLIEDELKEITSIRQLKIFNSGNFLDIEQIPVSVRDFIFKKSKELKVEELIFECHPLFITEKNLSQIREKLNFINYNPKIYIAIGLETADNIMLKKIKKGITLQNFKKTVKLLKKYNFYSRTYLMANLPYEKDIKTNLDKSIDFASNYSEKICIINTYPYGYAELFDIWLSRKWHPLDKKKFEKLVEKYKKNNKIELYFNDFISYPKFSLSRQKKMDLNGANKSNLIHNCYEVWQEYLADFYMPPKIKKVILFLPCSFRKPYSLSPTHKAIIERLKNVFGYEKIHQIMISNPGLIPREFESKYPFAHYNWSESQETYTIKKLYIKTTQGRIEKYLKNHKTSYIYTSKKPIFCYLKYESESYTALKNACKKQNIALLNLLDKEVYAFLKKEGVKNILTNQLLLDKMFLSLSKRKL